MKKTECTMQQKEYLIGRLETIVKKGIWQAFYKDYHKVMEWFYHAETALGTGQEKTVSGEQEKEDAEKMARIMENPLYLNSHRIFAGWAAMERLQVYQCLKEYVEATDRTVIAS